MNIDLPRFFSHFKSKNTHISLLQFMPENSNLKDFKDVFNTLQINEFLLFLAYLPAKSTMSDPTQKAKHNYKTFTIYSDETKEKALFGVRLFQNGNADIKCVLSNVTWNNMVEFARVLRKTE